MMSGESVLLAGAAMAVGSTALAVVGAAVVQPFLIGLALGASVGAIATVSTGFKLAARTRSSLKPGPMTRESPRPSAVP